MKACNQCGKCCLKYGGSGFGTASVEDLDVWQEQKPEVLEYVYSFSMPDLWVSPVTGNEMSRCPWLRKYPKREAYYCRIDDVRPGVCRNYPVSIEQMKKDGCEMLEPDDDSKSEAELMKQLSVLRRVDNTH